MASNQYQVKPDPETLQIVKSQLQAIALYTGTLTDIEAIYELDDDRFRTAPVIRPDVISYWKWMIDCGVVGEIDVFCMSFKFWWSYKEEVATYPEQDQLLTPWALFPNMTEQHPTKRLKRARTITYSLQRDGRAILDYLRAYNARQIELINDPAEDERQMQEIADLFFDAMIACGKTISEIIEILKADPEIETGGEWKNAFNNAYQKVKK